MEQGACGGADDLWVQHVHAVVHEDYGVAAGRIGRTDHGAGVARVAHLPEGGNLRGPTVLAKFDVIGSGVHGLGIADGRDALGVRTDAAHHVAGAVVHINRGILRGFDDLLQRGGDDTRMFQRPRNLYIQVLHHVRPPSDGLAHGLRAFDKKTARTFAAFGAGQIGDAAHAVGFRIIKNLGVDGHSHYPTAGSLRQSRD